MRKHKHSSNYPYHAEWVLNNGNKTVYELINGNKYLKELRNEIIAKRNNKH